MSFVKLIFLAIVAVVLFNVFSTSDKEFDGAIMLPLDTKIVAFGDSITYGYNVAQEQNYPTQLARLLQVEVINAGISGEDTRGGLARLPSVLDRYKPQILILCEGGNDILRRKSMLNAKENLAKMIKIAQQRGIHVVLVGVPTVDILRFDTAQIYRELAQELSVPLEDQVLVDILSDDALKIDTIHPNADGYELMSNALAKIVSDTYIPSSPL